MHILAQEDKLVDHILEEVHIQLEFEREDYIEEHSWMEEEGKRHWSSRAPVDWVWVCQGWYQWLAQDPS